MDWYLIGCIHLLSIQCHYTLNNLGLYFAVLFKTILLEEQFFDLQSEIVHTGIFHCICSAIRDECEDSGYQLHANA